MLERTLGLKMERMSVDDDLAAEERTGPVVVQGAPVQIMAGSKMVRLPGEVFQRYAAV
jgi:hypothetical protein